MFKKKDVILIIHYSVCATLIILSKFICKETKRYQNVLLKMSEKSLKVGAKTAFRRRFSSLFYRKTSFHTTRLHPFGRIATPFGVDGYTLWGKWCSLLSNTILRVTSRFLPWGKLQTIVSEQLASTVRKLLIISTNQMQCLSCPVQVADNGQKGI